MKTYSTEIIKDECAKINEGNRIDIKETDEYLALRSEMQSITNVKAMYCIAMYTVAFASWGLFFSNRCENEFKGTELLLLLPFFFFIVLQEKISELTEIHIKMQAIIWVHFNTIYESNCIKYKHLLYGENGPTFISRIIKIQSYHLSVAGVLIQMYNLIIKLERADIWTNFNMMTDSFVDVTIAFGTLLLSIIAMTFIFVRYWHSRDGEIRLIDMAVTIRNQKDIDDKRVSM